MNLKTLLSKFLGPKEQKQIFPLSVIQAGTPTSQQSRDTNYPVFFANNEHLLIPPFPMSDFISLYVTDSLSNCCINNLANLVCSPIVCKNSNSEIVSYIDDFVRRCELNQAIENLYVDSLIFGIGIAELIGDGPSLFESETILGLRSIHPMTVAIQIDAKGDKVFYRQRAGWNLQGPSFGAYDRPLDPSTLVVITNDNAERGYHSHYGMPLLQACKERIIQRSELLAASSLSAKNHASPVHFLMWTTQQPISEAEKTIMTNRLKESCDALDSTGGRWLHSAGVMGEYNYISLGHNTVPDNSALIDRLTIDIVSSCSLSPSSLGFTMGSSATSFENSSEASINAICNRQRNLVSQLTKIFRLLPFIEQECPVDDDEPILIDIEEPSQEQLKANAESFAVQLSNQMIMARAGLVSSEQCAKALGLDGVFDESQWEEFLAGPQEQTNQRDPNQNQQRISQLQKGNSKNNNPSGEKQSE